MQNKVAIIIVNWNGFEVTAKCLRSLLKIDYENYYIVVIDNGSTDGSVTKLKIEFPEVEYLELDANYGFTGGCNRGIDHCRQKNHPEYYLLLNNDTIVEHGFLREMVNVFLVEKHIGIVVPKIYYHDKPEHLYYAGGYVNAFTGLSRHRGKNEKDRGQYDNTEEVTFANGCAMLIKAEVIQTIGLLDNIFFATGEDVEYSYRAMKYGYKIFYAPRARLWHYEGYTAKKQKNESFWLYLVTRNIILVQKKYQPVFWYALFVAVFSIRWFLFLEVKYLLRFNWSVSKNLFWGMLDGLRGRVRYFRVEQ
jgi:GT2 family glycosyltransferase